MALSIMFIVLVRLSAPVKSSVVDLPIRTSRSTTRSFICPFKLLIIDLNLSRSNSGTPGTIKTFSANLSRS